MSSPSRNWVTRMNRRRQRRKEFLLSQTNGNGTPKLEYADKKRATLQVVYPDGHTYLARYHYDGQRWVLIRCDAPLAFLRFCGQKDAKRALTNRGCSFKWIGKTEISARPEVVRSVL